MLNQQPLPEFQTYLSLQHLTSEKAIPFLASWAAMFLAFAQKNSCQGVDILIAQFLDLLRSRMKEDWQIRQAHEAIQLYLFHYLKQRPAQEHPPWLRFSPNSFADISALINTTREMIQIKHYSYKTEKTYLQWVKRFHEYLNTVSPGAKPIDRWSSSDVKAFLSHLAVKGRVAASTQNQAFNAILFLFRDVLHKDLDNLKETVRAKRGSRLPVVLSKEEVKSLFQHLKEDDLLFLQLIYGTGMRVSEFVRLRVKDIDFKENLIFVRSGKGDKDRAVVLPERLKPALLKHLEEVKKNHEIDLKSGYGEVSLPFALSRKYPGAGKEWGWQFVFPSATLSADWNDGKIRRFHMSEKTIQRILRAAVTKAGISKPATVHTLRHSFATHLLMNGINIREVQELLGHKHVETTMIYTHVLRGSTSAPQSPLDELYKQTG